MRAQIEKEKRTRKQLPLYIGMGIICYIYVVLCVLQFVSLTASDARINKLEAFNLATGYVFTHPANIFPLHAEAFMYIALFTLLAASAGFMIYTSKSLRKHDNPDTVNGEARFMNSKEAQLFCTEKAEPLGEKTVDIEQNMILSKDLFLSINERNTHIVPNVLIAARAGAGKGQAIIDPNVLQNFASQLITDPSGELFRRYAKYKENQGYVVNCLNLEKLRDGSKYNPLAYIKEEKDVDILVQCMMDNLKAEDSGSGGDEFWNDTAKLFLEACILYLWHVAEPEDQTFESILKLIHMAQIDENDTDAVESELDILFSDLEKKDLENLAVKRYQDFKIGAGKTLKSILITVTSKMKKFELSDLQYMTSSDEMDLTHFADTKHVLFVIVPTGDGGTFNFMASMLYTQIFQEVYRYGNTRVMYSAKAFLPGGDIFKVVQGRNEAELASALKETKRFVKNLRAGHEIKYNKKRNLYYLKVKKTKEIVAWRGTKEEIEKIAAVIPKIRVERVQDVESNKVPTPVQFVLDEFKSTGKIPAFTDKISTVRKYGVSILIVLQAYAQLEMMYERDAPTIISNCPIKILMGTSDEDTIKKMTATTGKRTTTVEGTSYNANGGGSSSYSKSALELITPDLVAKLQYEYFFIMIDGEYPYYGKKFFVSKHPRYKEAKATAGKFFNPNAGKSKPLIPLREREGNKKTSVQELSKDAEEEKNIPNTVKSKEENSIPADAVPTSTPAIPVYDPDKDEGNFVQNNETEKNKLSNIIQKVNATDAKEALAGFEASFDTAQDMINVGLMESFGLSLDDSDETIKESVESTIVLDDFSDETFSFMMTN